MEPEAGDEVLSHRHKATSKALQPTSALVSYETDEEQYWAFKMHAAYADYSRRVSAAGFSQNTYSLHKFFDLV